MTEYILTNFFAIFIMNYLFHEGGKTKKTTNLKLGSKPKKGGNFFGSIGELVAPTGWESFVTTAELFALDRQMLR